MADVSSEEAYSQGQVAQKAGLTDGDCPYGPGTLAAEMWMEGFANSVIGEDALERVRKIIDND